MKQDTSERGEENEIIIERILTFIRNVLQIPPPDNDLRTDNDATVHDEVIILFHLTLYNIILSLSKLKYFEYFEGTEN